MSTIKAIFFARFHPKKGPHILHQVPEGALVPCLDADGTEQAPLFDFSAISSLILPSQEFCDRPINVCVSRYRVITYPVCIENSKYDRNQFIFNFALVLDEDEDFTGYTTIVRKLVSLFRNLEEQSGFLSREEVAVAGADLWSASATDEDLQSSMELPSVPDGADDGRKSSRRLDSIVGGKIYALCEMMFEDLNHYCECMIPIDDSNTINLKIFPTRPPPAPVFAWHVPLSTVELSILSTSSDLTLTRILPFIDGIASVSQIAQQAETDLNLTRKAVAHLLYYGCVILLDIFHFSAIYAPTADIGSFVEDLDTQEEAVRYVTVGQYRRLTEKELDGSHQELWAWKSNEASINTTNLVQLYLSLKQGQSLKSWCLEHNTLLAGIDVRRFITFGVIKGFIYRVHKYAVMDGVPDSGHGNADAETAFDPLRVEQWRDGRRGSVAPSSLGRDLPLARYIDGMHCFDEICTELHMSESNVTSRMKEVHKTVTFIYR